MQSRENIKFSILLQPDLTPTEIWISQTTETCIKMSECGLEKCGRWVSTRHGQLLSYLFLDSRIGGVTMYTDVFYPK